MLCMALLSYNLLKYLTIPIVNHNDCLLKNLKLFKKIDFALS